MAESSRRGGTAWVRTAACWLIVGVAAAQAPVVPADHYGPPVCGAAQSSSHRMSAEAALEEQRQGATNAQALLSDEPFENFGIERYRLADYADCVGSGGCYWADLDAQYKRAERALAMRVATGREGAKEKLAV